MKQRFRRRSEVAVLRRNTPVAEVLHLGFRYEGFDFSLSLSLLSHTRRETLYTMSHSKPGE